VTFATASSLRLAMRSRHRGRKAANFILKFGLGDEAVYTLRPSTGQVSWLG